MHGDDSQNTPARIIGDQAADGGAFTGDVVDETGRLLARYWRLIGVCVALFGVIAFGAAYVLPKIYLVNAKVIVLSKRLSAPGDASGNQAYVRYVSPVAEDLITEASILQTAPLIEETLLSLGRQYLAETPGSMPKDLDLEVDFSAPSLPTKAVEDFSENVAIDVVPGSYVISVDFTAQDSEFGLRFVDAFLDNYIARRHGLLENTGANEFHRKSQDYYREKLEEFDARLLALSQKSVLGDLVKEKELNLQLIETEATTAATLRDRLITVTGALTTFRRSAAAVRASRDALPAALPDQYADPSIQDASDRYAQALEALIKVRLTYREDSEAVFNADRLFQQQRDVFLRILTTKRGGLQGEAATLKSAIEAKDKRIKELSSRNSELESLIAAQATLINERQATLEAFLAASSRVDHSNAASVSDSIGFSNVRILQDAVVSSEPIGFSMKIMIAIGFICGGAFAVLIIAAREANSPYVKRHDDVASIFTSTPATVQLAEPASLELPRLAS